MIDRKHKEEVDYLQVISPNNRMHYHGFDYLRIIFCAIVVALHTGLITASYDLGKDFGKIIEFGIGYLAVPVFLQLSAYLYVLNSSKGTNRFKERIKYLASIYAFWLALNLIIPSGGKISSYFSSFKLILETLVGNHTVIYFIFELMLITILIEGARKFCNTLPKVLGAFIGSLVLMIYGKYLVESFGFGLGYANPFNFIPYAFSAILLARLTSPGVPWDTWKKYEVLVLLAALFAGLELFLLRGFIYMAYGRPSLIFASMLIVMWFQQTNFRPHRLVTVLSGLTLGVYLSHEIIRGFIVNLISDFGTSPNTLTVFLLTLMLSVLFSHFVKRTSLL
ncbi:MAG TPA: acyltransferase [Bacillota bacterium]|nr:acyltransferase [Bacillota bacterium]